MKKKKYMVCCETYNEKRVDSLCQSEEVKGIILGDLFCQKRMFENGIVDLILFMKMVMFTEKELLYQLPLYVTGRNLSEVISILKLISRHSQNIYAIVQDFGMAEVIGRDFPGIKLVWGEMGRTRENRFSDSFLNFLKIKGFYGMETSCIEFARRLAAFNIIPFYKNAKLTYQTVGRNCYFQYQTGNCDSEACRQGKYELETEDSSFSMTIDGYMLGKKNTYLNEETYLEFCNSHNVISVRCL